MQITKYFPSGRILTLLFVILTILITTTKPALAASAVTLSGGVLTITGDGANDQLTLSYAGGTYTLTDTGGQLIDVSAIAGSTGNGTSSVTIPDTGVTGLLFDLLAGDDAVTVNSVQPSFSGDFTIDGGTGTDTAALNGAIVTTGGGAVSVTVSQRISLGSGASITTDAGSVDLLANVGGTSAGNFRGVSLNNADIATNSGLITIIGEGGTSSNNQGVALQNASTVTSVTGDIQITGVGDDGASGDFKDGVLIIDGSLVETTGTGLTAGNIFINGTGQGGNASITGIEVNGGIIRTVDGDIQLTGTGGGNGAAASVGVESAVGSIIETTGDGNLTIMGNTTALSTPVPGVRAVTSGVFRTSGTGILSITATGINGEADLLVDGATLGSTIGTGNIMLNIDTIELTSSAVVQGQAGLTIDPRTAGTTIGLGGGVGTLNLTDTEIGRFSDGFSLITIGNGTAGDITVNTATFLDALTLTTAGNITDGGDDSGTDINNGSNTVVFSGTLAPGASPGTFAVIGHVLFNTNSAFNVELTGTPSGGSHDLLTVTGDVTIGSNVSLNLITTSYVEAAGTITIIDNDGLDGITGTFSGLAEGAQYHPDTTTTPDFLISYAGADGNDVILTAATPTAVTLNQLHIADANGKTFALIIMFTLLSLASVWWLRRPTYNK
ncbi:MAG: hypothetical protein KDE51_00055 [Anaerolineales bacterium]|nr:hypothetical protein [Anaerolineales bacterium]